MDWLGITVMTTAANFVVAYEELYKRNLFTASLVATILNIVLGSFTYAVTFTALQTVYRKNLRLKNDENDDDEVDEVGMKRTESNSNSGSFFKRLLESYAFRTIVAVSHAFGSLISWGVGGLLTGAVNDHLPNILLIYACFSLVTLCVFDIPEKLLPRGTVDIVGASHQIFHLGIIAGIFGLWYTFLFVFV